MTDQVCCRRETPLSNLRGKESFDSSSANLMINYWLQVDNVTKDGLLDTLSLCRGLRAPLSEPRLPLTASFLSPLLSHPTRSSTHTATEWKGVPAACFYHSICLLKAAFTYMRRTAAAPVRRLIANALTQSTVQYEPPSASKRGFGASTCTWECMWFD